MTALFQLFARAQQSALAGLLGVALGVVGAASVAAQDWQSRTEDNGSLMFGSVFEGSGLMGFSCTAPSPQNRPLIETGSHETHRSSPYTMFVNFADDPLVWTQALNTDQVTIILDGVGYRMPVIHLDELSGTALELAMTDPFVLALSGAREVLLDPGGGTAYQFGTSGLSAALAEAMGYCVDRWAALGHATPAALRPWRSGATFSGTFEGASGSVDLPPGVAVEIFRQCSSAYELEPGTYQSGDLDGDGAPDYAVNWRGVRCASAPGLNPFCGAANCSLEVYLSSRNYAGPREFLGTSIAIVPLGDGRNGIGIGGTYSVCGENNVYCSQPLVWNGVDFVR